MTAHTVEYIRYRIPEQQSAGFLAAYTRAAAQLAAAPQCVDYELARCEEDFEHFVLRITWTSTEDHIEGFRKSELFEDFLAEIRPFISSIEEMRHYKPTTVRGTGASVPTLYVWAGVPRPSTGSPRSSTTRSSRTTSSRPSSRDSLPSTRRMSRCGSGRCSGGRPGTPRRRAGTGTWSRSISGRGSPRCSGGGG